MASSLAQAGQAVIKKDALTCVSSYDEIHFGGIIYGFFNFLG